MPSDLTGTPTSLGIGTYNTSVDAPSGLGFNEAMAEIDALIAARISAPAGLSAGEVPVWNGSSFVRSSTTRIVNGGAALPQVTTSTFAGGPPASPSNGDIWIATGVDANGTRWQFQYNAGSASAYKWEFIGGAPLNAQSGATTTLSNGGTWITNNQLGCQVSLARGGDYLFTTAFWGVGAAGTSGQQEIGVSIGGAAPIVATSEAVSPASGGFTMAGGLVLTGVAATTANLAYLSNSNASAGWRSLTAVPVRVS